MISYNLRGLMWHGTNLKSPKGYLERVALQDTPVNHLPELLSPSVPFIVILVKDRRGGGLIGWQSTFSCSSERSTSSRHRRGSHRSKEEK